MEQAEDGILKHYAALQPPPRDPEGGGVHHHDVADNHQCSSHVPTGLPVERTQTNTLCHRHKLRLLDGGGDQVKYKQKNRGALCCLD